MKDEHLNSFFMAALLDMRASLTLQDQAGTYLFVTSLPDCWTVDEKVVPNDISVFGPAIAHILDEHKKRVQKTGVTEQIEIRHGDDRFFEFRILALPSTTATAQIITTIIDRSEERRREKVLQSLLREVSHRSKNLLAIIQSIATQTSHYTDSIESYVQKFRGRIFALSRSQDLITDSGWRGAHVEELLQQQVSSYIPNKVSLVAFEGRNLLLSPNAVMHLGLAFHELVVNALNHGSILKTGEQILVTCYVTELDGKKYVRIVWEEPRTIEIRAGSEEMITPPTRFGAAILQRVVPASVNGAAKYAFSASQVVYEIVFPMDVPDQA